MELPLLKSVDAPADLRRLGRQQLVPLASENQSTFTKGIYHFKIINNEKVYLEKVIVD